MSRDMRSVRPGKDATLQFYPDHDVFELVGTGYPTFRPDQMEIEPDTKTALITFTDEDLFPIRLRHLRRRVVIQERKRLGPNHLLVWLLGEFNG